MSNQKSSKMAETAKLPKFESNLARADRLFADEADDAKVIREFTKAYKAKGKTDKEWIKKRAAIYMRIAQRKAESAS